MKSFLVLLSFFVVGFANAQTDTTSSNDYFLTFVKKVYLNPTVYLRTTDFKERTNIGFVALPDLASSQNNASSGFEKGLQKLLRLLMQTDGGIRFYFNPDNATAPFTFWCTDNLWCKFKQPEKDSIQYYLNDAFSDSNLDLNNNQRFESTIDNTLDYIERVLAANPGECGDQPQNETTTINTKPLAINVHNTQGSKYDIDYKNYERLASNYATAFDEFTQQEWFAPSKMFVTGGGSEPLTMSIDLHDPQFKKENLKIEILKTHQVLAHTFSNDSVRFSLPENLSPSDPMEIIVKYKSQVDSVNYTVGLFMVNVVEEKKPKVVLLGANGYGVTPTDVSNIESYLNKIYKPAGVRFEVSKFTHVFMNDYPTMIEAEGSGMLSNYPSDLHDYVGDIKDFNNYSGETYYLVLGLNSSDPDLLGYMPRARNIGFIFFPEGSSSYSVEPIAHELGHGAFHFRHIFADEELGESSKGSTQNIMDYSTVSLKDALYLHQWNFIQDPAFVSWSDGDDEDAEIRSTVNTLVLTELKDGEFFHFITPNRKYISLPTSTREVEISLLERYTTDGSTDGPNTNFEAPIGSLVAFRDMYGKRWTNVGGSDKYVNDDGGTEVVYKPEDYDETSYGLDPGFSTTGAIVSWVKVDGGEIRPIYFKRFLEDFSIGTLFTNPYYTLICYQDFAVCGDFTHISNYPSNTTTVVGSKSSIQVVRGDLNIRFVLETINITDTNSVFPPVPPNSQVKEFAKISISDLFGLKNFYSIQEIVAYLGFMDMKQQDANALSVCSAVETSNTIIRIREIIRGPLFITYQQPAEGSSTIHTTIYKSQVPAMRNAVSTLLANNLTDYLQRLNLNGVSLDLVYQSLENYKQTVIEDPWGVDEEDAAWQSFLYDLYNLDVCNYTAINLATRMNLIRDIVLPNDNIWQATSQRGQSTDNWITRPLLYDLIWTTPENQKNEIYKLFFKDGGVTETFVKFWEDMDNGFLGEWGSFGYDATDYKVGKLVIQKLMTWPPKIDKTIYGNPDKKVTLSYPVSSPLKDFLDQKGGSYNLNDLYLPMGDVNIGGVSDLLVLGKDNQYGKEVEVPLFKLLGNYEKPVEMENGKFYISFNYRLSSIFLTSSGQPKWSEVSEFFTAVGNKIEVSPFQQIEVVMTKNYSDVGLDRGNTIQMTVLEAFLLQRDIDEAVQAGNVRILTVVGSTILTVATLGETAPLLVAALTTANAIDVYYTATKNDLTTSQRENSFFYSHWDDIKMLVDLTDIGINGIMMIKPSLIINSFTICRNARLFNTGRFFRWMKRADKLIDGSAPAGKMADAMSDIRRILDGESPFSINYQFNDMLDISNMGGMNLRSGVVGPNAPFKALDLNGDIFKSGKVFTNKIGSDIRMYVHAPVTNTRRPIGFVNNYISGAAEATFDVEAKIAQVTDLEELSIFTQRVYEMDQISGAELLESIQEMNKLKEQSVKINTGLSIPKSVGAYTTTGKLLYYGTGSGNSKVVTMMAVKYDGKIMVVAATKTAYQLIAQKIKQKEEEEEENNCEECKSYASQLICEKFDRLRNKPLDNTDNFTKLLCGKLVPTKVSSSLDWIYEHTEEWQNKLKYDLKWDSTNVNTLSFNRPQIDADLLEAWKLMQKSKPASTGFGQNYCRDYLSLLALSYLLEKSNVVSTLGGIDGVSEILKKNTTAPCEVCANNNPVYIKMDDYIEYVSYFAENYTGKTDYQKVIGSQGIKSGGPNQVNATAFILRVLYENQGYVSTISGFEEKIETINDDGETNRAFADVIENNNKIIECKSWVLAGLSFNSFCANTTPSGSAQQFITYLGSPNVNSMDDLEYWFDKMKLGGNTDPTPVKEKFQLMWLQNNVLTIKGEAAFTAIFNNSDLKTNLFANRNETAARAYFITIISDLNNNFYDFIKVK